jgi:sorting nexin-1/2
VKSASSRKTPARKVGVQPTLLEAVDSSFDPLGPLGDGAATPARPPIADQAPTPPQKEVGNRIVQSGYGRSTVDSADHEDAAAAAIRQRGPPPVQPASGGPVRQSQPSMSIEQAAKPIFEINVGDPHKVGDLTTSHIVYQVRTKVGGIMKLLGSH